MEQVRPRLEAFAAEMLGGLARSDQRAKGELYLRGLLMDGKRKSMQPMAERLGVDHQRLQQFVTSSTWDYDDGAGERGPVGGRGDRPGRLRHRRHRLSQGRHGLARWWRGMYSGTLGKTANCQIGVSVQLVTDTASVAANWRLFCPAVLGRHHGRRPGHGRAGPRDGGPGAGIPDEVRHREKWRLALDMLDQMTERLGAARNCRSRADAGYGDTTEFRLGLEERGLRYVVAVKDTTSAYPADAVPDRAGLHRPRPPTQARATATTRQPRATSPWPPAATPRRE